MNDSVRIQKYLADTGICSRRAGEALIAAGEVYVNGVRAELGQKILPGKDKVTVEGRPVRKPPQPKVTLAVNKPRGLVCSNADPHHPRTVFEIVPREFAKMRFFCAGRLDKDSEGLVILTTDGDLAHRLMHPSQQIVKRYRVSLEQPFPASKIPLLRKGVTAEGERLKVEKAFLLGARKPEASTEIEVHMHHGKKREIRQLFTVLGFDVRRLRRYRIGALELRGIPLRAGKVLSKREVELLFQSGAPAKIDSE